MPNYTEDSEGEVSKKKVVFYSKDLRKRQKLCLFTESRT
jgi:hypothetical protein